MRFGHILLIFLMVGVAQAADVTGVRAWQAPNQTRLVFDLTGPVDFDVFLVDAPGRLVVDFTQTSIKAPVRLPPDGRISKVRQAKRNSDDVRLVFDLTRDVVVQKALLPPSPPYGNRLVIDLVDKGGAPPRLEAGRAQTDRPQPRPGTFVVAIDAGHGGDDTGAIGASGTYEKNVVLAVARELKRRIDETPGMQGVLIRDGDYYVGLRERMERARNAHANLFVSVHADAFRESRVRGSSVFVLSPRGASSEAARWLAERENASDFAGGLTLSNKDAQLRSVLLDLSQTASRKTSRRVAAHVLRAMRKLGPLHFNEVQEAGFMVLKSPDIPSLLVETAYITNPEEEARLNDAAFQGELAGAIHAGILAFRRAPAADGRYASRTTPRSTSPRESAVAQR